MQETLLIIHIIAMALWFGGSIMMGFVNVSVGKLARLEASAGLARAETKFGMTFFMPMSILTLLSGVGLVLNSNDAYAFSDPFVSVGFLAVIAAAILGPVKLMPLGEAIADALEAGEVETAMTAGKQVMMFSVLIDILLIASIVVMVTKP